GVDGSPVCASVDALKRAAAVCPSIDRGRSHWVDRQRLDDAAFRPVAGPWPNLGACCLRHCQATQMLSTRWPREQQACKQCENAKYSVSRHKQPPREVFL